VGAGGLETILVGDVGEGVLLAIVTDPGDGSSHHQGLVLGAGVLQLSLLLLGGAIAGFKSIVVSPDSNVVIFILHNDGVFGVSLRRGGG